MALALRKKRQVRSFEERWQTGQGRGFAHVRRAQDLALSKKNQQVLGNETLKQREHEGQKCHFHCDLD